MSFLSARRAVSAGIVAAASVAAFVAPSAANALPGHCKGTATEGAGSSLQSEAQAIWDPGFNVSKAGCAGGPKVTYHSIGSGAGYKEWAVSKHYGTVGFVGTDNTVNAAEKEAVEKQVEEGKSSKLLTVPVLQGAVTLVVNLPAGCTANSKVAPGRLGFDQLTLTGIYEGSINKWSQIVEVPGAGNELTGTECKPSEDAITPIVRKDGSGTTHIFKKYLNNIQDKPMPAETGAEETWAQLAEGSVSTKWPTAAKVKFPAETTGPGLLKEVAATPGSVGYANLADARNAANGGFTGQSASRFWVVVEASAKGSGEKTKRKYADPSSNGDAASGAESNCKKTEFSNGKGSFPPPSVESAWNEVTAKQFSKTYPLCGLTYDLTLTNYASYANNGGNENEGQTVKDFIGYVVSKKGGAKDIKAHDYNELPKALVKSAEEGVSLTG